MFTGIIENTGTVVALKKNKSNLHISAKAPFLKEIKIDQSIAHNGVCLTVVEKKKDFYTVTAIDETLQKTNLRFLKVGDKINLERCMKANGRFDGHIVQGHVDCVAQVHSIEEKNGSWMFEFSVPDANKEWKNLIVEKGSVCVNGVSLTVVEAVARNRKPETFFSTAIIPYTYEHTNFHLLEKGDFVNIEFDIIGKYVARMVASRF